MDLVLSDIIENAGSTNSARVVMPTMVAELVILAVGGGDPSLGPLNLDSRLPACESKRFQPS